MSLADHILDAVFPRFCVSCKSEGSLLCRGCRATWWHEPPKPNDEHLAFYAYANPVVRQLICAWKYDYDHSGFETLKEHAFDLLPALKHRAAALGVQAVVPLPLSAHRERERGFNQSVALAEWVARELSIPVLHALDRRHRRGHQADRSVEERQQAMIANPFLFKEGVELPKVVLIVDDVWTTGATLEAAKKTLKNAGVESILAFTLAKG